jgi:hypothetical protein
MKNIFAKQKEVEFMSVQTNLHNWRFIGMEMEALGQRLDAAREALSRANSEWSRWYWDETVNRLMIQWQYLPALHDGDATMTLLPRWTVGYDFYEGAAEVGGLDIIDRTYHTVFRDSVDLDASWENHRAARLAKAQF